LARLVLSFTSSDSRAQGVLARASSRRRSQ
jgi:hypothetical protein